MKTQPFWRLVLLAGLALSASSASASLLVFSQLCPRSSPLDTSAFHYCQNLVEAETLNTTYNVNDPGVIPPPVPPSQVFTGAATATATPTEWHLTLDLSVTDYLRSNYVWSTNPQVFVATTGVSAAQTTDKVTVSGGTGVYDLNYILGVTGTLDQFGSDLVGIQFCAQLAIPGGTGTFDSHCTSVGNTLPSTITLTYADLPFGGPVEPTLTIALYALVMPITEDEIATLGGDTVTGRVSGNFGSTVTLERITITDDDGNPIPGLTVVSDSGYDYPIDPRNLDQGPGPGVPEPGSIWLIASGIALLGMRRRSSGL